MQWKSSTDGAWRAHFPACIGQSISLFSNYFVLLCSQYLLARRAQRSVAVHLFAISGGKTSSTAAIRLLSS